jgi:murein DD-endopeptidase MepM/ murein hydrolase activator NlpD
MVPMSRLTSALVICLLAACSAAPQPQQRSLAREAASTAEPGNGLSARQIRYLNPGSAAAERACFSAPLDEVAVTSPFGLRQDPIHRDRQRMHRGVDLRGAAGTPVYATASGHALLAGWCDRGTGNCVVIEHEHGWRSQYFHLSEVHIRAGQRVNRGQHIGDIGSTGRSTGPHLHFQLGRDGEAIDPIQLVCPDT